MAHNTVFGHISAIMAFQAIFHTGTDFIAIQCFPVGYTMMTPGTIKLLVLLMRKNILIPKSGSFPFSFTRSR
jgi:hypothetical protein